MPLLPFPPSMQEVRRAPAQATVMVSGQALQIPRLPAGSEEARSGLKGLRARADAEVANLGAAITESLQACAAPLSKAGASSREAEDLQRMQALLDDPAFAALMERVVAQRKAWLQSLGVLPAAKTDRAEEASTSHSPTVREVEARIRAATRRPIAPLPEYGLMEDEAYGRIMDVRDQNLAPAADRFEEQRIHRTAWMQVSQREGASMAGPWNALVDHFDETLRTAAPLFEEPPAGQESPVHRRMRAMLAAKLMARCRVCLWMAEVMWSDLAGAEGPKPLDPIPSAAG